MSDEIIIIENFWDKSEAERKAEYARLKKEADDRKKAEEVKKTVKK